MWDMEDGPRRTLALAFPEMNKLRKTNARQSEDHTVPPPPAAAAAAVAEEEEEEEAAAEAASAAAIVQLPSKGLQQLS